MMDIYYYYYECLYIVQVIVGAIIHSPGATLVQLQYGQYRNYIYILHGGECNMTFFGSEEHFRTAKKVILHEPQCHSCYIIYDTICFKTFFNGILMTRNLL